jgi:hypothetical protein
MAKTWADLTPDEALALRNRIERAMTIGDEAAADLARRRQEALFRPKATTPEKPIQRAPEQPVRRPASAPRDWTAEADYFASIAALQTDEKIASLVEAIGQAIGEIRNEIEADYAGRLARMKAELQKAFSEEIATMRTEFLHAIRADEAELETRLRRLDRLIVLAERSTLVNGPILDVRPN